MLVLALDTATPAVTAGVVELTDRTAPLDPRSARVTHDPRKHAELLMPGVLAAAADAGVTLRELAAVVVGTGPGPFTGLRVGMVTAAALGDALGLPVHGVCSLDAIAATPARGRPGRAPAGGHRRPAARGLLGRLRRGRPAARRPAVSRAGRARSTRLPSSAGPWRPADRPR